jgi:hypothetical protein
MNLAARNSLEKKEMKFKIFEIFHSILVTRQFDFFLNEILAIFSAERGGCQAMNRPLSRPNPADWISGRIEFISRHLPANIQSTALFTLAELQMQLNTGTWNFIKMKMRILLAIRFRDAFNFSLDE